MRFDLAEEGEGGAAGCCCCLVFVLGGGGGGRGESIGMEGANVVEGDV